MTPLRDNFNVISPGFGSLVNCYINKTENKSKERRNKLLILFQSVTLHAVTYWYLTESIIWFRVNIAEYKKPIKCIKQNEIISFIMEISKMIQLTKQTQHQPSQLKNNQYKISSRKPENCMQCAVPIIKSWT